MFKIGTLEKQWEFLFCILYLPSMSKRRQRLLVDLGKGTHDLNYIVWYNFRWVLHKGSGFHRYAAFSIGSPALSPTSSAWHLRHTCAVLRPSRTSLVFAKSAFRRLGVRIRADFPVPCSLCSWHRKQYSYSQISQGNKYVLNAFLH